MDKDFERQEAEKVYDSQKETMHRRGFLLGLKKWSKVVIGGALLSSAVWNAVTEGEAEAASWANRAGAGGWANRAGPGGAVVAPRGGGAWANRAGGGGAWANRGAAWANRGGTWINRF
jgi:hypothetical protein